MRRGILLLEFERLLLRGRSGGEIDGGRLSWRVGGAQRAETGEKKERQGW